ncbi:uncharacterized protein [Choristoneura fumiferana]|uniref:uncharacterized protein n=1 Tax=Choristoneura fumiferana TaxID=7141 RepID=UPI003D159251
MPPKIHAKIQFMSKYRMLTDFASTISEAQGTSAVAVAKRNFGSYYNQFVLAYEALLGLSSEEIPEGEMEQIHAQFSEINKLLVKLEQASEGRGSADEPRIPHHSQKLPTLIRSAFEQRYGTCHHVLPSVHQLLEVLDEQCRVQLAVSPTPEAASGRSYHRPPPRRGRQGASTSEARGRPARGVHQVHQGQLLRLGNHLKGTNLWCQHQVTVGNRPSVSHRAGNPSIMHKAWARVATHLCVHLNRARAATQMYQ